MGKPPGAIYRAFYPGDWEAEVRISDKTRESAIARQGNFANNVCRQVKDALRAACGTDSPDFIDWELLKLEFVRRD